MSNGFEITKETWQAMPAEQRDWILFETLQKMNARLGKLEDKNKKWTWINSGFAVCGGAVGGFMFSFLKFLGVK